MKRVLATACLLTVLAGCASWRTPTLEVSGQTLASLGNQFAKVSEVFARGCVEPRSIPVQACTDFRTFGVNFKTVGSRAGSERSGRPEEHATACHPISVSVGRAGRTRHRCLRRKLMSTAAIIALLAQVIPLVPDAVDSVYKIIAALRAHQETPEEVKVALDSIESQLRDAEVRVQAAKLPA